MKKFILSAFIALAAATSSFAQFSNESISFCSDFLNSGLPSYDLPSYDLPSISLPSYDLPSYDLPSISLPYPAFLLLRLLAAITRTTAHM